jgi:CRP/FNR family transcriptional regulator
MDRIAILAQASFFRDLGDGSRRALAEQCRARDAAKGEVLFREGDEGHALYLLNRGAVQLHKNGPGGAEVVIKVVRPGEVFGEVVLFERDRYPVTATALTAAGLFVFPRRDIRALLGREEFRDDFIAMLMRKQRYLAERILYLGTADVEERLFLFLREHAGEATSFPMPISKKSVAAAIGTAPETLSRLLVRLARRRAVRWKGRHVEVDWSRAPRTAER